MTSVTFLWLRNGPFQIDFLIDFLSTKENVMLTMNREILENTYFFLLCRVCIADCNNPNIIGRICDAQGLRMNLGSATNQEKVGFCLGWLVFWLVFGWFF
jgi:hypothetical protein